MAIEHEVHRERGVFGHRTPDHVANVLTGGYVGEGVGGLACAVLCVLGLAEIVPGLMNSIAAIVAGATLAWIGGAVLSQFNKAVIGANFGSRLRIETGTLALCVGGTAGIVLSILALLGIHAEVLTSITAIVYGAALLLGSYVACGIDIAVPRWKQRPIETFPGSRAAALGIGVLAGIGAAVLGILGLAGIAVATLNLVAILSVGGALMLAGSVTSAEFVKML
ncbi:MAG TPA: hypothetical protein VNI01_15350 [Elusimicrobiota bacterium]|jgi:hypothetical protein|nr:hypothetical protein [Elusimicrobiota bacterium]